MWRGFEDYSSSKMEPSAPFGVEFEDELRALHIEDEQETSRVEKYGGM